MYFLHPVSPEYAGKRHGCYDNAFKHFPVVRFCPIFNMLFFIISSTEIDKKTTCCNFLEVRPFFPYFDPTINHIR